MTTARMLMLAGIFAIGLPCMASAATPVHEGYLVDSEGNIVKSGFGVCWHTGFWTPAMAVAECDPVAAKPELTLPNRDTTKTPSPPPPPPPASAPQKAPLPTIRLSDTAHFDFDESMLKAEDKAALDNLVRKLDGATYEVIHVAGHADRIGSVEYNMGLSLRRANEVRRYLTSKGIPAERIQTEGKGEAQPVTRGTDCMGMTRARIIACLQPDRRAEITVVITEEEAEQHK